MIPSFLGVMTHIFGCNTFIFPWVVGVQGSLLLIVDGRNTTFLVERSYFQGRTVGFREGTAYFLSSNGELVVSDNGLDIWDCLVKRIVT